MPTDRVHADGDRGWVGIRPEKVLIGDEGAALDAPGNTIPGGVVTDVSFYGVSTQYLVRMPWGQELLVFEQNTGAHPPAPHRRRRSTCPGGRSTPSCSTTARTPPAGAQRVDQD